MLVLDGYSFLQVGKGYVLNTKF